MKNNQQSNNRIVQIIIVVLLITVGVLFLVNRSGSSSDSQNSTDAVDQTQDENSTDTADVTDSTEDAANSVTASYSDGTTTVEATFDNDAKTVSFTQADVGSVTLPAAISGSGARYANADESIVFWEHQDVATITHNDETVFQGNLVTTDGSNE